MSLDQDIRYSAPDPTNTLNPYGLFNYLIVPQTLSGVGAPGALTAVLGSTFIDTSTGQEYILNQNGVWVPFVNYSSFAPVIPDPLVRNQIDVSTIEPNIANNTNVQFTMPTSGDAVNVGTAGSPTNTQIFANGSIVLDSLTSAIVIADTLGNQISLEPQSITGTAGLIISSVGQLSLSGSSNIPVSVPLSLQDGTNIAPAYTFFNDSSGMYLVAPGTLGFSVSGVQTLAASAAELFVASSQIDAQSGTAAAPGYSFAADSSSGLFLNVAGNPAVSASGAPIMGWATGITTSMSTILPSVANTYDLGSAIRDFRNIYSQNVLNVISDERRKKNVEALAPGLDLVENLCPVSFQFKDSDDERFKIGFIAQSTEAVMSEYDKDYDVVNYDVANDAYTMKYESLIGVLVKSIQELSTRLKDLEAKSN